MVIPFRIGYVLSQTVRWVAQLAFPTVLACAGLLIVFGGALGLGYAPQNAQSTISLVFSLLVTLGFVYYIAVVSRDMAVARPRLRVAIASMAALMIGFLMASLVFFGGVYVSALAYPRIGFLVVIPVLVAAFLAAHVFLWVFIRSFAPWRAFEGTATLQDALAESRAMITGNGLRIFGLIILAALVIGCVDLGLTLIVASMGGITVTGGSVSIPAWFAAFLLVLECVRNAWLAAVHISVYNYVKEQRADAGATSA